MYLSIISYGSKSIETLFLDHEQFSEIGAMKWWEDTTESSAMQISSAYRSVPSSKKVITDIVS